MRKETAPSEKTKKDELKSHEEVQASIRDQGQVFDDENQEPGEEVTSQDPSHKESGAEANTEDPGTEHPTGAAEPSVVQAGIEGPYSIRASAETDSTGGPAPEKDASSEPASGGSGHIDQPGHDTSPGEANVEQSPSIPDPGTPSETGTTPENKPLAADEGEESTDEPTSEISSAETGVSAENEEQTPSPQDAEKSVGGDSTVENRPLEASEGDESTAEPTSEIPSAETGFSTENEEQIPPQQDFERSVEGEATPENKPLPASGSEASAAADTTSEPGTPDSTGLDSSSGEASEAPSSSIPDPGTPSETGTTPESQPLAASEDEESIAEPTSEIPSAETGFSTENEEQISLEQDPEQSVEGETTPENKPLPASGSEASAAADTTSEPGTPDSTGLDSSSGEASEAPSSSIPDPGTPSETGTTPESKISAAGEDEESTDEPTSEISSAETGFSAEDAEQTPPSEDAEQPVAGDPAAENEPLATGHGDEPATESASESTNQDKTARAENIEKPATTPASAQSAGEGTTGAPEPPVETAKAEGGEAQDDSSGKDTKDHQDIEIAAHEDDIHDDGDELVHADYSQYSKEELVGTIKKLTKIDDFKKLDLVLNIIDPLFQDKKQAERKEALGKYIAEGGSEEDFAYKNELDHRYDAYYKLIKERKNKFYGDLGRQKLENYQKATGLLEKLRHLVDGEESTTSINAIKEIQEEWKTIGQVPPQHVRNLWASYNALMDRFYDNRSIYFELKELDRRKNLTAKEELCVRAEKLEEVANLKDAIKELNELHNEYKHIGPVPKVRQEALWQRFKAASDKVYARRKTYYEDLKKDLEVNLEAKARLRDEVQPYATFDSDRIVDWNSKTQEILDIQKRWEAIGGLPRDRAHEINKPFWSAFKRFFNNKNGFFKKLEGQREGNLKLKEELVTKANELKDSTDWNQTASDLKNLQNEWRNIGPVPEKHRNEVYQRFKKACDFFFENRRNRFKEVEKGYEKNLKQKQEICQKILTLAREGAGDIGQLEALQEEWNNIGFVPKNAIRSSQDMFAKAVDQFIASSSLDEDEKNKLKITTRLTSLKGTPNANRKLNKKEFTLRRQITNLENDISLWKNNLEFFANSKNADQVREEFDEKIEKAKRQLQELKAQLKIIRDI